MQSQVQASAYTLILDRKIGDDNPTHVQHEGRISCIRTRHVRDHETAFTPFSVLDSLNPDNLRVQLGLNEKKFSKFVFTCNIHDEHAYSAWLQTWKANYGILSRAIRQVRAYSSSIEHETDPYGKFRGEVQSFLNDLTRLANLMMIGRYNMKRAHLSVI